MENKSDFYARGAEYGLASLPRDYLESNSLQEIPTRGIYSHEVTPVPSLGGLALLLVAGLLAGRARPRRRD